MKSALVDRLKRNRREFPISPSDLTPKKAVVPAKPIAKGRGWVGGGSGKTTSVERGGRTVAYSGTPGQHVRTGMPDEPKTTPSLPGNLRSKIGKLPRTTVGKPPVRRGPMPPIGRVNKKKV